MVRGRFVAVDARVRTKRMIPVGRNLPAWLTNVPEAWIHVILLGFPKDDEAGCSLIFRAN